MTKAAVPGWYDDPSGTASYRYWDGIQWTEVTRDADGAASSATTIMPEERQPRRGRRWVLAAVSTAAVGALVAGGLAISAAIGGGDPSGTVVVSGYAWAPAVELAAEERLELPMTVDPRTLPGGEEDGVFAVFIDSELSDSVDHADFWSEKERTVGIRAWEYAELSVSVDAPELALIEDVYYFDRVAEESEDGRDWIDASWLSYETYYVVQYYDRDGELRDTPLVHTVRSSEDEVFFETIVPSFSTVGTGGSVRASWEAPEGADGDTEYLLIKNYLDPDGKTVPEVVVATTETSWTSEAPAYGEAPESTFKLYSGSAVDAIGASLFSYEEPEPLARMAVVAVGDGKHSRIRYVDANSVIGTVPFDVASSTYRDMFDLPDNGDFSRTSTQYPVTTLNGDTVTLPVRLNPATISPHVATLEMLVSDEAAAQMTGLVKGTVPGTDFRVTLYTLKPDDVSEAEWPDRMASYVSAYNARAIEETPKTGAVTSFADLNGSVNDVTPSTVAPESDYDLFGTDDLTLYVAANLMAGEQAVDLSAYEGLPGLPDPYDAYREAYIQNPLISAVVETAVIENDILYVTYADAAAVKQTQTELNGLAEDIVAQIIDGAMSDAEKAIAINAWMVENIEYDYETYDEVSEISFLAQPVGEQWRAWDSRGALIDGLVVCGGYADAFNLLAREAGLESVYVSGNTAGGAHAWNHVLIDGRWKAIDTTWNDNDTDTTRYLLIDEDEFTGSAARTINDSGWMPEMFQGDYATD